MSATESDFWNEIKRGIGSKPLSHFQRIETSTAPGVPDLNYCIDSISGWIELKRVNTVPARSSTILKIPHFTGEQRGWLLKRASCGGRCFVALRAGEETFLFLGGQASRYLGISWTVEQCRTRAVYHSVGRVRWDDFVKELTL